jgi:putative transposase
VWRQRHVLAVIEHASRKIRDRDGKFPALFDAIVADAGIEVVLSGARMPRMNQSHLVHALREFEQFCNEHRPHQGITNARPRRPLPVPLAARQTTRLHIQRRDQLGGVIHEYLHAA